MDDWAKLRTAPLDEPAAWNAFRAWTEAPPRTPQKRLRELGAELYLLLVPLIGRVLRLRFRKLQSADRDDVCSILAIKLPEKIWKYQSRFRQCETPPQFAALTAVTVRNLVYDHIRSETRKNKDIDPELVYIRPQVSVPKEVDLKMAVQELPIALTEFALKRDRLQFGKRPILAVMRLMVAGKRVSDDMLRNWLGVGRPERCIAFCTLMARWYLWKFRDKFSPILDGELADRIVGVDQLAHVL